MPDRTAPAAKPSLRLAKPVVYHPVRRQPPARTVQIRRPAATGQPHRSPARALATVPEQLQDYLNFALEQAGSTQLMTSELIRTLAAHAANNLRVLNQMAAELLSAAAERNLPRIDESLFFDLFSPTGSKPRRNHTKQ